MRDEVVGAFVSKGSYIYIFLEITLTPRVRVGMAIDTPPEALRWL